MNPIRRHYSRNWKSYRYHETDHQSLHRQRPLHLHLPVLHSEDLPAGGSRVHLLRPQPPGLSPGLRHAAPRADRPPGRGRHHRRGDRVHEDPLCLPAAVVFHLPARLSLPPGRGDHPAGRGGPPGHQRPREMVLHHHVGDAHPLLHQRVDARPARRLRAL